MFVDNENGHLCASGGHFYVQRYSCFSATNKQIVFMPHPADTDLIFWSQAVDTRHSWTSTVIDTDGATLYQRCISGLQD